MVELLYLAGAFFGIQVLLGASEMASLSHAFDNKNGKRACN